ncbi:MAG: hypothetical protein BAJALOKI2v1_950003 [Promethearchaeota archaeon]|nr:MAG: hypothetical protein BAJALOKI2v1_950003 [Candidatus Lokiarchaeota archaeon]
MEEFENLIRKFSIDFRSEINAHYQNFYEYLLDLYSYKGFRGEDGNLGEVPLDKNQNLQNLLIKIPKIGMNTIGVSDQTLSRLENDLEKSLEKIDIKEHSLGQLFQKAFKRYINYILFSILIEFIIDVDSEKIEKLEEFDLLGRNFIKKLKTFKSQNLIPQKLREIFKNNEKRRRIIHSYFRFPEELKEQGLEKESKVEKMEQDFEEKKTSNEKTENDDEVIRELEKAIRKNLESLKKSIKSSISSSDMILKKAESTYPQTFLDHFGNFRAIDTQKAEKFKIDFDKLKKSILDQRDFYDLESLFYYLSIMKMLDLKIPLKRSDLIEIIQKFVRNGVFIQSDKDEEKSDLSALFYGLLALSNLQKLKNNNFIDFNSIKRILEEEIEHFIPEKLHINYFIFFSLEILRRNKFYGLEDKNLLTPLINLNLFDLDEFNLILDFYEQIVCIKLLDKNANLNFFKALYIKHLKKMMEKNGSINHSITKTARTLLILDLLELNKKEIMMSSRLLKYITQATEFFKLSKNKYKLDWEQDPLALKIELRMLFWSLLACGQFSIAI